MMPEARKAHQARLRKPLYLDAAGAERVEAEGPALRVVMREGLARFYPLARLSRLVVHGPVEFGAQALLEIMDHGLGIVFLDGRERLAGYLLSARPLVDSSVNQRLEDLAASGELGEILDDWRLAQIRRAILRDVGPRLGWLRDLRARNVRKLAAARIRARTAMDWGRQMRAFRPLLRSVALRALKEAGIAPRWLDPEPQRPDLAALIAGLLEWSLWRAGLELRRAPDLGGWRGKVAFFERQEIIGIRARELTDALVRHVHSVPVVRPQRT